MRSRASNVFGNTGPWQDAPREHPGGGVMRRGETVLPGSRREWRAQRAVTPRRRREKQSVSKDTEKQKFAAPAGSASLTGHAAIRAQISAATAEQVGADSELASAATSESIGASCPPPSAPTSSKTSTPVLDPHAQVPAAEHTMTRLSHKEGNDDANEVGAGDHD